MTSNFSMALRNLFLAVIKPFRSNIIDYKTGQCIGKALLLPWGGKIHVIGAEGVFIPVFLPQERLTYWKLEIGFTGHAPVDFPRITDEDAAVSTHPPRSSGDPVARGDLGAGGAT